MTLTKLIETIRAIEGPLPLSIFRNPHFREAFALGLVPCRPVENLSAARCRRAVDLLRELRVFGPRRIGTSVADGLRLRAAYDLIVAGLAVEVQPGTFALARGRGAAA